MLQIRQADECDIRNLVHLDDECFDTYYYEKTKLSKSDFQDYLRWNQSVLLVAVLDSHIIGYVAGTIHTSRAQPTAHLDSIAVSSVTQQRGIGSQLLYFFIQEAKRQACKMIMLEVATANKEGLRFFSKRGFREIADLPEYYGRGLDGVLMGLSI